MRVTVKLLGFVFWWFFFNCGQCQAAKLKSCHDLENGFTYSHPYNEEEIFYTCNTGYKPFTENWWDSATCSKGSWTEETRCIREEECGAFPSVHHGKVKQNIHDRATAEVECDPGFISTQRFITCVNGTWEKPVCEVGVHCDIPPKVENALITSKPEEYYVDGSSVTYACRRLFLMKGKSTVFCRNGIWEEKPTCEAKRTDTPREDMIYDFENKAVVRTAENPFKNPEQKLSRLSSSTSSSRNVDRTSRPAESNERDGGRQRRRQKTLVTM